MTKIFRQLFSKNRKTTSISLHANNLRKKENYSKLYMFMQFCPSVRLESNKSFIASKELRWFLYLIKEQQKYVLILKLR